MVEGFTNPLPALSLTTLFLPGTAGYYSGPDPITSLDVSKPVPFWGGRRENIFRYLSGGSVLVSVRSKFALPLPRTTRPLLYMCEGRDLSERTMTMLRVASMIVHFLQDIATRIYIVYAVRRCVVACVTNRNKKMTKIRKMKTHKRNDILKNDLTHEKPHSPRY